MYMRLRPFSTFNSSILPLNSSLQSGKLKIYSCLPNNSGFRLSNGVKHTGSLALIGGVRLNWNSSDPTASIKLLLQSLRPIPEFLVIGGPFKNLNLKNSKESIFKGFEDEFGCNLQVFEDKMKAASTFNTLIDDDRSAIILLS